jgi:hypothetical protein
MNRAPASPKELRYMRRGPMAALHTWREILKIEI